jgi:DNA repair protein RadA/Sms
MKVTEVADMGDALRVLPRRSRPDGPQEDGARR